MKPIQLRPIFIVFFCCFVLQTLGTPFLNPVADPGADPWVIRSGDYYYYMHTTGGDVQIRQTRKITGATGIAAAGPSYTFTPPAPYNQNVWAPELHFLQGKWYIYYAADNGVDANHRMFVAEASNPLGPYTYKGKIADSTDHWAIDGTVLEKSDGSLYFVWSGWAGAAAGHQYIYIAPMSNPWTISGPRVNLSTTSYSWEYAGSMLVNEGPQILKRNGKTSIVYSANGAWTDNYCLGFFANTDGNYLNPASWTKNSLSIFKTYVGSDGSVYGPGHCSFTTSVDGTEDWIVYHAALYQGAGWFRSVRAQRFYWNGNDSPYFDHPIPTGVVLTVPSGEDVSEERAVLRSDGRLATIAVTTGTSIAGNLQVSSNGAFGGWSSLGGSGFKKASVARYPDNRLVVFGVGNSPVWFNKENTAGGTWAGWVNLGGPAVTSVKSAIYSDQRLIVAGVGDGTSVQINAQNANGTWGGWGDLGGSGFWNIDLVARPDDRLVVFGVGIGHVFVKSQIQANGGWGAWQEFTDGPNFNHIQAVLRPSPDNRFVLFACGSGSAVWVNAQITNEGSWTGWQSLQGSGFSRIDPVLRPDGSFVVFATGDSTSIWMNSQNGFQGTWSGWTDLGGSGFGTVDALTFPDGKLAVFGHNYGGGEWLKSQTTPSGSWGSFTNLGNSLR